jgi:bla regulator protein blaR1
VSAQATLDLLGGRLLAASAVGLVLGVGLLALRRPLRRLPPGLQAGVWWLVSARLLLELAGAPGLALPGLAVRAESWLARTVASPAPILEGARAATETGHAPALPITPRGLALEAFAEEAPAAAPGPPLAAGPAAAAPRRSSVTPGRLAAAIWLLGAALALARGARAAGLARRLARQAAPVTDRAARREWARALAAVPGLDEVELRRSPEISTPLAVGWRRPAVLLPAAPPLAGEELRLALAHELVHLRRRDSWRALVPALARRLLFFHPLARLAEREFALATEGACDAEVLRRVGAEPGRYGSLLVRFALDPRRAARLAPLWPLAGPSIQRRLSMLARPAVAPRRLLAWSPLVAVAALSLVVPLRLTAAPGEEPAQEAVAPAPTPEPEPVPTAEPAPRPAAAPRAAVRENPSWSWVAPAPPVPPVASVPPAAPAPPSALLLSARLAPLAPLAPLPPLPPAPVTAPLPPLPPLAPELRGADWLVLVEPGHRLSIDATRQAQRRAEELADEHGGSALLVGRDGRDWVVTDRAAIDSIRELFREGMEPLRAGSEELRAAARQIRERERHAWEEERARVRTSWEQERRATQVREEARWLAELERELERAASDGMEAVAPRLEAAARELELARAELARAAESALIDGVERQRRLSDSFDERHRALDAERRALEAAHRDLEREVEQQVDELERELERRLAELFARGLASPLER